MTEREGGTSATNDERVAHAGRRLYVASSWRNPNQPTLVHLLRKLGHEVYDFRNPGVGYDNPTGVDKGFMWEHIDPDWQGWSPRAYVRALDHEVALRGFQSDWQAMRWADTGVLLLPSGRSAHIEAGYFVGAGKELHVLLTESMEPELMYRMATAIHTSPSALIAALARERGLATPLHRHGAP